jgi:UDP-glucuronate 4-epimerase
MKTILVTGAAGFIGMHTSLELLKNFRVVGIDNLSSYYDVSLKKKRLEILRKNKNFFFYKTDICNTKKITKIFKKIKPDIVIHLAAIAGVRYSILNPDIYIKTNLVGFGNIINLSKNLKVQHFVYASSSSVYGGNKKKIAEEKDNVDNPVSLYAATKKSNELIAYTYSSLFNMPTTGLRFFTVYGPWGRPDMALYMFVKSILNKKKINVFNRGKMFRDFTYIDDIVDGIIKIVNKPANRKNKKLSQIPYSVFNIGSGKSVKLLKFISEIEKNLQIRAKKNMMPMQPGDVKKSLSSIKKLNRWVGYQPGFNIQEGIKNFVNWYLSFYKK